MCLVLLAWKANPKYPLVLASNRDEFYERPTAPAAIWENDPDVIGGTDKLAGGSWLAMHHNGRLAVVTNFRQGLAEKKDAPTRGLLVSDFVTGLASPDNYLERLSRRAGEYNGFNLLVMNRDSCRYYSNQSNQIVPLANGIYGLSNALLDTPWPKVQRGKKSFGECLQQGSWTATDLLEILSDETMAADDVLPDTGVGLELERRLSPIFIKSPRYGTRVSTVVAISDSGHVTFVERSFDPEREIFSTQTLEFDLTR